MATTILGIRLDKRNQNALYLQEILSHHGCIIKSRIGLHDVDKNRCSTSGVILLELIGTAKENTSLEKAIKSIKGVKLQKMAL